MHVLNSYVGTTSHDSLEALRLHLAGRRQRGRPGGGSAGRCGPVCWRRSARRPLARRYPLLWCRGTAAGPFTIPAGSSWTSLWRWRSAETATRASRRSGVSRPSSVRSPLLRPSPARATPSPLPGRLLRPRPRRNRRARGHPPQAGQRRLERCRRPHHGRPTRPNCPRPPGGPAQRHITTLPRRVPAFPIVFHAAVGP